jgi:GAF domain-containing protein
MADLDDPKRLAQFKAPIVQLGSDGVLDDCVREAARRADAPIALVTFVMSKIQLFRAAVGLPPELDASRATSRCDSFCQFVVKTEGPFIVTDAKNDSRVPQNLVKAYGISSYLGVPIRAGGHVLGSLCVADGKERQWPQDLVDELTALAARVSLRLDQLSTQKKPSADPARTPSALAGEVSTLSEVIQRSLVEVGPMVRLAKGAGEGLAPDALARGAAVLTEAIDFYDDMRAAVDELCVNAARLQRALSSAQAN